MFPFSRKKEKAAPGAVAAPVIAPVIGAGARPRPPLPPEKPARATRESPPAPDALQQPISYEAPVYDNIHAPPTATRPTLPPRAPVSVSAMIAGMNGHAAPPQLPPRHNLQHVQQQPPHPAARKEQPAEEEPRIVFRTNRRSTEDQRALSGSLAFGSLKEFDIAGLSLPALACVQVAERRLILHRNVAGDFGFSIRRVQHSTAAGDLRTVVFAEPTEAKIGPPRPDDVAGLLPGDELVEVQGERVSRLSRDELQEVVRQAGDTINLVVRAVPELAEFCSRSADLRQAEAGDSLLLPADVDTSLQEVIPDDVRVWLLHKGGYTQARLLERLPDGRARITVAGREMTVDATDVDKANSTGQERIGDLAGLKYLNETSAVHVLRHRFGSGLAYSNAGSSSLLFISGGDAPPHNERLVGLFKGCRKAQMPPHVYATAQHIYRSMQQSAAGQSVLLQGVSGSGKSQQLLQLSYYLSHAAGWTKTLSFGRLSSALGVLQAMGNAATGLNSDSSRFLMMLQLGFDKAAALKSAKICASLVESERVLARPEGESNFHVFYYLWEGADEKIRSKLKLEEIDNPAPLMKPLRQEEDRAAAREAWSSFLSALSSLGVSQPAIEGICVTLGAIFHLARADATPGTPAARATFLRGAHAAHAASLLGVSHDALSSAVFRGRAAGGSAAAAAASINRISISNRALDGVDALKTFVAALYQELFYSVVELLNRGLGSTATDAAFTHINIIDPPGCTYSAAWQPARPKQQQAATNGATATHQSKRPPGTLYDLVFNYVNDRLAEAFHDTHFAEMQELYSREQVEVSIQPPIGSPHPLNRLLDQKQQLLNSVDIDRRSEERRGLFAIVEEESVFPGATDDMLIERIFVHLGDCSRLIRRGSTPLQFVLAHGLDSHPVAYDVRGWLRVAYPSEIAAAVRPLIGVTKSNAISCLFNPVLPSSSNGGAAMPRPSESALKLRRLTQSAHLADGGSAAKRAISSSLLAALAAQTDYVFSTVRRGARSHFIHCIQSSTGPTRTTIGVVTGSSSLTPSSGASSAGLSPLSTSSSSDSLDVPYVRNQMRGLLLMDAVRASNRGYPERFSFRDFRRRFECLIVSSYQAIGAANQSTFDSSFADAVDDRAAVAKILEKMDVHESRFRLGISQVLLQTDVVSMLEERRELSLSGLIVSFQQSCRRHLAQRWLAKRRLLETAIRCIQKNGRSYCAVREWPWWRLYTRVVPLLAVTRSDAEAREWEQRMRALERQIGELKQTKSRLEGRVCELEEEITRGASNVHEMSVALEREGQARIVAERRLQGVEGDAARLSRVSSNATMGAPSGVVDEAVVETLKKELADAREQEEALRVRTQRTVAQLHESESELAELRATTATLEKKQARFDADLRALETAAAEQKKTAERMERERDEALVVSARRQTEAKEAKDESAELRVQLTRTRRELEEGGGSNGAGGEDIESLRKTKRELEAKVRDQEDELDDLSGARQMLQQQVSRLEMQSSRLQTDIKKEAEARENECEELRASYQRRLRAFEEQVADLTESNQSLTKQNRLLDARCRQNDAAQHSLEYSGGQSRRELRKALALLADTEALLVHERENNQNGAVVRQLREQLEDAEALKVAALKGRHGLESELAELRTQLEMALAGRKVAEERALSLLREKNTGIALLEEKDEQMQALLKKYKASVQQNQIDGIAIADYIEQIADLQSSKQKLVDELHERTSQLEHLHQHTVEKHRMLLMEQKLREMQAKLDLETAMRTRLESLVVKHSDEAETASEKLSDALAARDREAETVRKTRKEMVHVTEALEEARKHETELAHRNKAAKSTTEKLEEQVRKLTTDLKLAEKRAEAMRVALAEGIDGAIDEEDEEGESDGEDEYRCSETMSTRSGHRSVSSKRRLDEEESVSNGMSML